MTGDALPASTAVRLLSAVAAGTEEFLGAIDTSPVLVAEMGADDDLSSIPSTSPPFVVVVITNGQPAGPAPVVADLALTLGDPALTPPGWVGVKDVDTALDGLMEQIERSPQAAVILAQVLRATETLGTSHALLVESLAYSTLQSGPAFTAWLQERRTNTRTPRPEPDKVVLVERSDDELTVTLDRPWVRNAVNRQVRDELCAALTIASADPTIETVNLRGAGPAFSSGGDLDEFGTFLDPATAHLVRMGRSPARLLANLSERVTAYVHGACVGAGIELAAFAHRVVADPDSRFELPEVSLGLIPGAGGTLSIPRRIGRQRAMWMGLSGVSVDVTTARTWGLVDEVVVAP